jgi:hypothetical protein
MRQHWPWRRVIDGLTTRRMGRDGDIWDHDATLKVGDRRNEVVQVLQPNNQDIRS